MLKGKNGSESETIKLPYEETQFLDYLDAQELPPILVDLLERSQANIFYSGCVIVEVRDYRQNLSSSSYDTKYVLLRPTYQSLVCDVNNLTSDPSWSVDDKLALEAQLLLATEGPLCLNPNPEVGLVANQLQFNLKKFNTPALKSKLRSNSHAFQTRALLASSGPTPSSLKLMDFLGRYKKPHPPVNLRLAKTPQTTDTWKQKHIPLGIPSRLDVDLYAKMIERPKITSDNSPETVQEITLEGEKTNNRNYYCKVTIRRRPTDLQYLGELYLEEDTSGGANNNGNARTREEQMARGGKACQFFLGSKLSAQKYLQQFQDLYTEEGRKSVKICSYLPGQQSTQGTLSSAGSVTQNPTQGTQDGQNALSTAQDDTSNNNHGLGVPAASQATTVKLPAGAASLAHLDTASMANFPTYGQKLMAFSQQGGVGRATAAQVVTINSGSVIASPAKLAQPTNRKGTFVTSTPQIIMTSKPTPGKGQSVLLQRTSQVDGTSRPSPTTPTAQYPGVASSYMQTVVCSGSGTTVALPAGMSVSGGTHVVNVTHGGGTIATGSLQAQFIGIKGQNIQPAPPTPLTLLQTQQGHLAQGRQQTTTFTIPGNLVPISQISSVGGVATLNTAQIQAKTSPQTTPVGQPTPILPNTPMSPQSGMTTVTINARPILPQQPQQQRKLQTARTLINRSGTPTIQPLVPIGGQLAPAGAQIPQQQFQVRIPVQFSQQQLQQSAQGSQGQTLVQVSHGQAGQTLMQAPQAQTLVQTTHGQTLVQGSHGQTLVQASPIQIQSTSQPQILQPQIQVKSVPQHSVGGGKGKSPGGQRRRSQNK
ncbi:transcription factor SPT20 homolog isoform X2 [Nematostella vectensis]|nr:transcription factor SPT20 homolog isoform X2 [Nematostella vectensis]